MLGLLAAVGILPACTRYYASDPNLTSPSGEVLPNEANAPRALIGLLRGENFGKLLVRCG